MKPRKPETHDFITIHFLENGIRLEPTPEGIDEAKNYLDDGNESDGALWSMLESFLDNGWVNIPPWDIRAITDAPIMSEDFTIDDDGNLVPATDKPEDAVVYWHENYAVESCIAKWAVGESVFWTKAK